MFYITFLYNGIFYSSFAYYSTCYASSYMISYDMCFFLILYRMLYHIVCPSLQPFKMRILTQKNHKRTNYQSHNS